MELFRKKIIDKIWGREVWYELPDLESFGLLLKVIETTDNLSVQVHPDDSFAIEQGLKRGKTEMWYILDADKDAKIVDGFSSDVSREELCDLLNDGNIENVLNYENVEKGDVFLIPAGRVHAIGKGIKLVEIQQISDVTYRLFDYNRVDEDGVERELHIDKALHVADCSKITETKTRYKVENGNARLIENEYFTVNLLSKSCEKKLSGPVAYVCVEGSAVINGINLEELDCVILSQCETLNLSLDKSKILEMSSNT